MSQFTLRHKIELGLDWEEFIGGVFVETNLGDVEDELECVICDDDELLRGIAGSEGCDNDDDWGMKSCEGGDMGRG